jgi:NADPH-dependent glutamate synthase beta subunit-like oxidoreductase
VLSRHIESRAELADFRFVFIATGAQQGRLLGVPGESLVGVVDALAFLKAYCYGECVPAARGKRTAVLGGGHTAFDAARAAIRSGAESVTVYYRRTVAEMGAYADEIESAIAEGVEIHDLSLPVRFETDDERTLNGMTLTRMALTDPDEEGRRLAVPVPDDLVSVRCDLVVRAIGQVLPQLPIHEGIRRSSWDGLAADYQSGSTSIDSVFAGGDCVLGASSVVRAIDSGKRAALGIDRALGGAGELPPQQDRSIARPFGLFNADEQFA